MDSQIQVISSVEDIRNRVYWIRGKQVMLDFDLADIYGYEVKRLNEQVKRNNRRFPEDFLFQLNREEVELVKSQFATSRNETFFEGQDGGRRKLHYAFTEQGIYMLMTVLRGELAIKQSIAIVRTFKSMKDYILEKQGLIGQREYLQLSMQISDNIAETLSLRRNLNEVEEQVASVVDKLSEIVYKSELSNIMTEFGEPQIKRGYLVLDGQPFMADLAYSEIYSNANKSIYIVDNYIGIKTLEHLICCKPNVEIKIFSDNINNGLRKAIYDDFCKEYSGIQVELRQTGGCFHDRYIFIDYGTEDEIIYHCGASSKDAGNRTTSITTISDKINYSKVIKNLLGNPVLLLT